MEGIVISGAVLMGWAIRRKSAEVLSARKENRRKAALRAQAWEEARAQKRREGTWMQIMEVQG